MSTPAKAIAPKTAQSTGPVAWDEYFPLINKGIMGVILVLAVVFATGVDVTKLGGRMFGGNSDSVATVASASGTSLGSFSGLSLSISGPGGWKVIVGVVVVALCIAGGALAILSSSGRDASWMKKQQEKHKGDQQKKPANAAPVNQATDADCNLSSYKLFFGPKDESAPSDTPASSTSA